MSPVSIEHCDATGDMSPPRGLATPVFGTVFGARVSRVKKRSPTKYVIKNYVLHGKTSQACKLSK